MLQKLLRLQLNHPGSNYCNLVKKILYVFLLLLMFSGCTNSRWIILDEPEVDYSDRQQTDSRPVVLAMNSPSVTDPVLKLESAEINEVEYGLKLVSERHIQTYRPRYVLMALGLGASAMTIYLANSPDVINYDVSTEQRNIMTASGVVIGAASAFALRPYGDPRPTSEKVYLNTVGTSIGSDTTRISVDQQVKARLVYENQIVAEADELQFENGELLLDLHNDFPEYHIVALEPSELTLEVEYEQQWFDFTIPVKEVLAPYVAITRNNAAVRTEPNQNMARVITNLEIDSSLPLQEIPDDTWFLTRHNLSDAYVLQEDAEIQWRAAGEESAALESGIAGYGEIDVEQQLPVRRQRPERVGVIVNFGNYTGTVQNIQNNERTARLVRDYMTQSMGIPQSNILQLTDMTYSEWQDFSSDVTSDELGAMHIKPDTTELIVYYLGHGLSASGNQLYLLPSDFGSTGSRISMTDFLDTFGQLQTASQLYLFETDFTEVSVTGQQSGMSSGRSAAIREVSQSFLQNRNNTALFFATNTNQQAGIFASPDGRVNNIHGFFTYYFLQALKNQHENTGSVFRYIQRNVTFTSRRYHDRPQDPQFFGDTSLVILPSDN